jgi:hypothetical protein
MWICGQCRNENADAATHCWMCGAWKTGPNIAASQTPGDSARPPQGDCAPLWDPVRTRRAHVPRRFGIGTMMIVTACFAVLFSILKVIGASWQAYVFIPSVIVGAGLAQVLLFRGRRPRTASVIAGIIMGAVLSFVGFFIEGVNSESRNGLPVSYFLERWLIFMLCPGLFLFPIAGYLSGLMASAVFLFCERREQAEEDKAAQVKK